MSLDAATLTLLRASVREALVQDGPEGLLDVLDGLGWDEVLIADEAAATGMLFDEQGASLSSSIALDAVVLRAIGATAPARRVAYPAGPDAWIPQDVPQRLEGALVLGPPSPAERFVAPVRRPAGPALAVLEIPPDSCRPLIGIDPDAGWSLVDGPVVEVRVAAQGPEAERALTRARAAAHRALAAEIAALTRGALEVAVAHVGSRAQFGRPVGTFQSVRHRLAEAHARICGTEALLAAAWDVAADRHEVAPDVAESEAEVAASLAKASAGATHVAVLGHAMQVCGAMGLTWAHPLHRRARRGFLLDTLFGSSDDLVAASGRRLMAGGTPTFAPLPGPGDLHENGRRVS